MPTQQETFDTVVAHLRKQNQKSYDPVSGMCLYRGPNGLKCAAGILIPDEKYEARFEGKGISVSEVLVALFKSEGHDVNLVEDLQRLHDCVDVTYWEEDLRRVAYNRHLTYTPASPA